MQLQFSRNLSLYFPHILRGLRTLYRLFPQGSFLYLASYSFLYNNQINASALIGQSAMGYCAGNPIEWKNRPSSEEFVNHSPAARDTNYSRVLPTSRVVYQPSNHRHLWSIA